MSLTQAQQFSVDHEGDLALIAIPGSGKTHTLVARAVEILKKPYNSICMVTFTRAAAAEMKDRIKQAGGDMRRVQCATFHSVCLQMLKKANIKSPKIIAPYQTFSYYKRIREQHAPEGMTEKVLQHVIEYYAGMKDPMDDGSDSYFYLYKIYRSMLQSDGLVDFYEILRRVIKGLESEEIECLNVTHIMFDEFQDANPFMIFWLLAHYMEGVQITVVGDDDQAIYTSFARSLGMNAFKSFKNFPNQVEFAEPIKFINLDQCFRCPQEILNHANKVIINNTNRLPKKLNSAVSTIGSVEVREFFTQTEEIKSLMNEVLQAPNDWSILARTNRDLEPLEASLEAYGVPFYRKSSSSIWDNDVAGFIIGVLQVTAKDMSMLASVASFIGATEAQIEHLISEVQYHHQLRTMDDNPFLPVLKSLLHEIRRWINSGNVNEILTDLESYLRDHFYNRSNKIKSLTPVLIRVLKSFNASTPSELVKMIDRVVISQNDKEKDTDGGVTLMTLHSSKGLQWKNVWIFNLQQGVCPSNQAIEAFDITEERRLFYVGMTRSESRLVLSCSRYAEDSRCVASKEAGGNLEGLRRLERSIFIEESEIPISEFKSNAESELKQQEFTEDTVDY